MGRRSSTVAPAPAKAKRGIASLAVSVRVKPEFSESDALPPSSVASRARFADILPGSASQGLAFERLARPLVSAVVRGHNATLFAYGQTGSGKTHTIFGPPNCLTEANGADNPDWGVFPRVAAELLARPNATLSVTAVEVYLDRMFDLLNARAPVTLGGGNIKASVLHSAAGGRNDPTARDASGKWRAPKLKVAAGVAEFAGNGAESRPLASVLDIIAVARTVEATRTATAHALNDRSSRSHAVLTLSLAQVEGSKLRTSQFLFVDLAGSERIKKSEVEGRAEAEARNVNTSLSALGRVVASIASGARHVPFRDSLLTRYMQPALSSRVVTGVVLTVRSEAEYTQETASTLSFGARISDIRRRHSVASSAPPVAVDISSMRSELEVLLAALQSEMVELESQGGRGGINLEFPKPTRDSFLQYQARLAAAQASRAAANEAAQEARAANDEAAQQRAQEQLEAAEQAIVVNEGLVIRGKMTGIFADPSPRWVALEAQQRDLQARLRLCAVGPSM